VPKKLLILVLALAFAPSCLPQAQQGSQQVIQSLTRANELRAAGRTQEARQIYDTLLARLRPQGPSPELGTVLLGLSDLAMAAGDYDQVIALSRDALAVYEKCSNDLGLAQEGLALAHGNIGMAHMNAGRYPEAAAEEETALRLFTANTYARKEDIVRTSNNLGNIYYYQARYTEALRVYESALREVEKAGSEEWAPQQRQFTLFNLATLYQRLGNDQRAIDIYKEIERSPKLLLASDLAHLYANLGVSYRRLGDGEKALDTYDKAERLYARQNDADGELGILKNKGIVLALELGRPQDALKKFTEVRARAEKSRSRREAMQATLYEGQTLFLMNRLPEAEKKFSEALASAVQLGTVEEQWKALYRLGLVAQRNGHPDLAEAKFREAVGGIESLRSKLQLTILKTDFLADKRDVYDALIKLLLDRQDPAAAFEFMERSRARVFQDRFFSSAQTSPTTLHSVQGRLDADTALLEFWTGADAIGAIWITRDAAGVTQSRLAPEDLRQMVRFISGLPETLGADWQAGFRRLSAWLPHGITPLTSNRYHRLLIVPDGFLSLVPFELLASASGEPLLENHDVTYLPAAALLSRGRSAPSAGLHFPWQRQLLAFGDPAVIGHGESSLVASTREQISGNLPSSAEEVRAIAGMSNGAASLFLGQRNRKQFFFSAARASLLHVSTHAVADMDNPERSRLLFSPDAAGEANNYVFLKELYDLDLRGVNLATLSACDTERGKLVPGEGIQAFSRALLSAGSKSTLTTLWRVPDQPTAEFMKQFYYFLLKKHKPKAEALRLAKLQFLRSGTVLSHPSYWAAFVLNGEGEEPVPQFISWYVLIGPVVLLAIGVWWFVRRRKQLANSK
jgi:CHAT domain-containing protein/tetratricopeptide (TPR) repeat protein